MAQPGETDRLDDQMAPAPQLGREPEPVSTAGYEDPCQFCPRCSSRLAEIKCKLLCETCGYYMSCADYY